MKTDDISNHGRPRGCAPPNQVWSALALATGLLVAGCATPAKTPLPPGKTEQANLTPRQALARLEAGNARFVAGKCLPRDWPRQRAQTAAAQHPFAVVLSCMDSRVSSELVFDQGLGDIFSVRVAGNILNDENLGSLEFACKLAGTKLIVVVGHTGCGAVKGASQGTQLGHLTGLLEKIQPSVAAAKSQPPSLPPTPAQNPPDGDFLNTVVELNVRHILRQIREQSPVLEELIASGKVEVVGGIYDLASGRVRFLTQ